jgi:hypothetical protein
MKRYKKDVNYLQQLRFSDYLEDALKVQEVQNWHQWDALMALLACLKHQNGTATALGDYKEGIIYF